MLVSMPSLSKDFNGFPIDSWGLTSAGYNYLVLPENLAPEKLEEDLFKFVVKYHSPEDAARKKFKLQPLRESTLINNTQRTLVHHQTQT
jgi:hypothetical protein